MITMITIAYIVMKNLHIYNLTTVLSLQTNDRHNEPLFMPSAESFTSSRPQQIYLHHK